jgi:hypothetical protein
MNASDLTIDTVVVLFVKHSATGRFVFHGRTEVGSATTFVTFICAVFSIAP